MSRPRILLADDHTMLLGAFEELLKSDYDIVGTVADGRALIEAAERLVPDIIVADVSMPVLNGLDAGRAIRKKFPRVKLIFVTMNEDPDIAARAFRIGASGYLLKRSAVSELRSAIVEVLRGRSYMTPLITDGVIGLLTHGDGEDAHELTPRQREVLQLLAEGRSMKEIAAILNTTPRTVAFHKYRMMEALHVKTTAELIQFAVRQHLV
jgi:DNA-binding NarL/FixJ family response regulator